jgi:hypothetical protein
MEGTQRITDDLDRLCRVAASSNQVFQFVPGRMALHRTALSPLRSAKAAAEQRRYAPCIIEETCNDG